MRKVLKILGFTVLALLLLGIVYVNVALPALPEGTNEVIEKVKKGELMSLKGEEGFAFNDSTKIWYESILPKDSIKGSILLVMGISNDALAWPTYFLEPLVESGYQVIRFDNRGTGLTDWMEDWSEENAYSLDDLAADAIAVLDELAVEKAHVIGVSLGGMIAQNISIRHPDRVATLTSMMSSGNIMDEDLPGINTTLIKDLILTQLKYGVIKTESNQIKLHIMARQLLRGGQKYELNIEDIAQTVLYNLRNRRGDNPTAFRQHSVATMKSGSRYEALQELKVPTLIIHGKSDPLINFEHGKKCYETIPNAEKLWVEGMGHDIPEAFVDEVVAATLNHIDKGSHTNTFNFGSEYIANGFDFPVGKPNAKGYYNAQAFGENNHLGDDWNSVKGGNSDLGDPIYSIANGYVKFAEDIGGGWGNVIRVLHQLPDGKRYESLYAHCDSILVQAGDWLQRGQQIGTIGTANGRYSAHLHLEIRDNIDLPIGGGYAEDQAGYLDPTVFIKKHRAISQPRLTH